MSRVSRLASEGHVSSVNALKQAPNLAETSNFTASKCDM